MKTNPCLDCSKINEDKNNTECLRCRKRIRYVRHLSRSLDGYAMYADDPCDLDVHCASDITRL